MMQTLSRAIDRVKERTAELRLDAGAAGTSAVGPLHLCGHDIEGVSVGGQETCIILPRAKLAFDIGRCPQRAVFQPLVLITHGHLDHVGGLHFHASSRKLQGLSPPTYGVPEHLVEKVQRLLALAAELEGGDGYEANVLPIPADHEVEVMGQTLRAFPTVHPVPSQGYILYSYRRKLKPELVGRAQEDIRALRLSGVEVTDAYHTPEVAFTGDTSGALFEGDAPPDLYRAKLLIMELTFVDDAVSVEQARERGHMHIADLVAHAHKFHNEQILLTHFSARYKQSQILEALDAYMPASLRSKCVPLLNGFSP